MGSVIRPERKRLTMNEWHNVLQFLSRINKGEFEEAKDFKYRGALWTKGRDVRGYIDRLDDVGYGWFVQCEATKRVCASGAGPLQVAMPDLLAEMLRLHGDKIAKQVFGKKTNTGSLPEGSEESGTKSLATEGVL